MNTAPPAEQPLLAEIAELRARLAEAEETLRAIYSGEVDALVVQSPDGPRLFTLQGADADSNRFRGEILAQVSDAVIAVDNESRVTYFNAAAERQYGSTASEALGRCLDEIYDCRWLRPEDAAASEAALRENGQWRGENIYVKRNGEIIHVESSVVCLRERDGTQTGLLAVIRDITERKRAEAEQQRTLALLDTLIRFAPIGFCFFDLDLRFVLVNERLAEINGIPADRHVGRHVSEIVPTLAQTAQDVTRRILQTGDAVKDHEFSGETLSLPGMVRHWSESWYPIRTSVGEAIGFGVLIEEITERKRTEEALRRAQDLLKLRADDLEKTVAARTAKLRERTVELQRANTALGESEERFRQMADNVRDVFWLADAEFRHVFYVSPAYEEIWGRPCRDLAKSPQAWLEAVHPEDREQVGRAFLSIGHLELPVDCEYRVVRPDGSVRWIVDQGVPVRDNSGNVYRVAGVARDITENKQAEAKLKRVQEELLRISEREKQLIAQELHDGLCQHFAGTALMSSLLHKRLAARNDPDAGDAKYICELLNTGVHEARNLSHGLHPVQPEEGGLMSALAGLSQTVTKLFHVKCKFRCDGSVLINNPTAANHLFRIAQEAVNNAMKHGQATALVITLKEGGEGVTLSIRDNGIGIPRNWSATGMGMQIMNHRATASGATLSVRRAGKRGTVVTCTLPCCS